jgi:thioesterase domain-containing protein
MGVRVAACGPDRVVLRAPLEDNLNHKSTAFGGSLFSLAVLSGWSLLYLFLRARGVAAQIVIHQSNIAYLHPVTGDFTAECAAGDAALLERALARYGRRGMARVQLHSTVRDGDLPAVRFQGSYALLRAER